MKNLILNEDACIGCGCCIAIDPDHFDFNEDGLAKVINTENIETNSVINAVESCPVAAISFESENSCNCESCPNSCGCGCN
ncbi:MAG: ferredoxin [bacterium]